MQGLFRSIFDTESEKFLLSKKYSAALLFFILRSSQSETFKKGHKINTGVLYTKKANFFPINVLYKKYQDFELKNE